MRALGTQTDLSPMQANTRTSHVTTGEWVALEAERVARTACARAAGMSSAAASTCPEYSCRGRTPAASRTRAQPGRQRAARYRRRREQQQRAATARRAPRRRRAALLGHVAACTRICTWTPWSLGAWPCCDARNCLAGVAASAAAAALRTVAAERSGRGRGGDDCHRRAAVEGGEARRGAAPPTAAAAAATGETRACASAVTGCSEGAPESRATGVIFCGGLPSLYFIVRSPHTGQPISLIG